MDYTINPPALSTIVRSWLRGGISVELSVGLTWLVYSLALGNGVFGPPLPILALSAVLWTVLLLVQCVFEHTLTVAGDAMTVRTWAGAVLGRTGRRFPLQRPQLTRGRNARPGGGLRGSRLSLYDFDGRRHRFAFTLIGYQKLAAAIQGIAPAHGGSRPW